jgi:hypothetical protein
MSESSPDRASPEYAPIGDFVSYGALHSSALHSGSQALAGEPLRDVEAQPAQPSQPLRSQPQRASRRRARAKKQGVDQTCWQTMSRGNKNLLYCMLITSAVLVVMGIVCYVLHTRVPSYTPANCSVVISDQRDDANNIRINAAFTCDSGTYDATATIYSPWHHGTSFVSTPPVDNWLFGAYICVGSFVVLWLAVIAVIMRCQCGYLICFY